MQILTNYGFIIKYGVMIGLCAFGIYFLLKK